MQKKRILLIIVFVALLVWIFAMLNRPPDAPLIPDDPADETEIDAPPQPGIPDASEEIPPESQPSRTPLEEAGIQPAVPVPPDAGDADGDTLESVEIAPTESETYDLAWANARRERMNAWIREDPERALSEALSPRRHAALPASIRELVETPLATEGFYGVVAICNHGPDEEHIGSCEITHEVVTNFGTFDAEGYPASIYGAREERLTEENASIYGVVMDGHIALHEHDVVVIDDGPGYPGGRYAVYYRGQEWTTDDLAEVEALKARLSGE
ncbi:MAG: hypothetical protein JJU29_14235 [Verrucomicrobia bacterium]|nr:hypothetical protein [Verrucomicrobiota bacterium]